MDERHRTAYGPGPAVPYLTVRPLEGCRGVRAAGEIGLATHMIWERALEQAVREGEAVYYLELSEVTFVDVAGAGALAAAAGRLGDGRRLVVRRPPPTLRRVLETFWPDLSTIEVSVS
ncbi:STAS domain-containing protein [Streptomyces toyocaensis]|uniref:STAS domain-containing protein n=1 Tax=Streptomyces toyocaensis TaxID=55952 RepID=UPI00389A0794